MRQLYLPLKEASYTIHIGSSLLSDSSLLNSFCEGSSILIVSNTVVAPLYIDCLRNSLKEKFTSNKIHQIIIKDGEIHKSKENYFQILDYLVENNFRRNDMLIALGGGVIGDLSGFVAASYQRGMSFIQVPTTLLSQVDSSVGGKTAINHSLGKNLIGAFYQPKTVIIDVETLKTLPDREYYSGFGEVIKYALLGELKIKQLLNNNIEQFLKRDKEKLKELIYLSCQMKASIVAKDEKEKGERALLNLGHTFAHALETLTEYKYYLHGEAVAIGILMALTFSSKMKLINDEVINEYKNLFEKLNLPTKIKVELSVNDILDIMKKDKKNQSDSYRFVLVENDRCILKEISENTLLVEVINEYLMPNIEV